jgi:biofilm PGA synthesis N-glycosyltransferase PgaC
MCPLEWLFWGCFALATYTYIFYPISLVLANCLVRRERASGPVQTSVSFLLPVHNEEQNLERRLDELSRMIEASGISGEVIVISDASTDRTVEIARQFAQRGVRAVEMATKQGKAAALNAGAAAASGALLIFADARQRWADDALLRLVENFADPAIGAVSGDLVLESSPGVLAGVGLYWRFEKWLRRQESRIGSQVGDDVYWPMHVVLQGYRVVHDERAKAFDRLPEYPRDEFRRKVRTLAGNFQLLTRLPAAALFPWANRVWWQWISHKLMRLAVPWALLGLFVSCFFLKSEWYQILFWAQTAAYALGVLGLIPPLGRNIKLLGAAASFLVLNAAAWLAFWVWITGQAGQSWHKAQYQQPAESG